MGVIVPRISDDEITAGWRAVHGPAGPPPRILRRRRMRHGAGLSGSHFERVRVACGGARVDAVLKLSRIPAGPPTRERLFFAELRDRVPVRVPRCLGLGPAVTGADGWVLMERLPAAKRLDDWTLGDVRAALGVLARLHAAFLDVAPPALPRPFTRDVDGLLAWVVPGVRALRARCAELTHLPQVAGEGALARLQAIAARGDTVRAAFARSPETLLHGDYHRANVVARAGEEPIVFDWQFAGVGPPACDLAVFWLYLGVVNRPTPFGLDRLILRPRALTWSEVVETYGRALRALSPGVDLDAIASCADAAIACEAVRTIGYLAAGMEPFLGLLRFVYRDHPRAGRLLARYLGLDQGFSLLAEIFEEFEARAGRFLAPASATVTLGGSPRR